MMDDLERGLLKALRRHDTNKAHAQARALSRAKEFARPSRKQLPSDPQPGYTVILAVREKRMSALDIRFEHKTNSISKLEAQIEAEQAARAAGYPVLGYVVDIVREV